MTARCRAAPREALAAAHGDAAAALLEERKVAQQLVGEPVHLPPGAEQLLGSHGTALGRGVARGAVCVTRAVRVRRATAAQLLVPALLGLEREVLGVAAPRASERAALRERHGADAAAVMQREALDVRDAQPVPRGRDALARALLARPLAGPRYSTCSVLLMMSSCSVRDSSTNNAL